MACKLCQIHVKIDICLMKYHVNLAEKWRMTVHWSLYMALQGCELPYPYNTVKYTNMVGRRHGWNGQTGILVRFTYCKIFKDRWLFNVANTFSWHSISTIFKFSKYRHQGISAKLKFQLNTHACSVILYIYIYIYAKLNCFMQ